MAIDPARARADTPGCEAVLHLNNAGAARDEIALVDDATRAFDMAFPFAVDGMDAAGVKARRALRRRPSARACTAARARACPRPCRDVIP